MNVFAISGSLQAGSSNTALLRAVRAQAPVGLDVVLYESMGDLPYFNPDIDGDPGPPAVVDLRSKLAAADTVVIASPEYAHSLPGVLKNALDWVVGSGELYGKRVAVLCASPRPTGGELGRAALEQTLAAQGARIVFSRTVPILRSHELPDELSGDTTTQTITDMFSSFGVQS